MRDRLACSTLLVACVCALGLGGASCNSNDGIVVDLDNAIRVNDAADEVIGTMADAINEGLLVVDDSKAEHWTDPADGASIPAATPPTFKWHKIQTARHGVSSGDFTWLRFEASGYSEPIDVVALTVEEWTPSAEEWARLTAATGPVKVTVTNCYAMVGIVKDGPYRAMSPSATFTITH
jgi:hypothetical protein